MSPYRIAAVREPECKHQVVAIPDGGLWCMRCNQTLSSSDLERLAGFLGVRPDSITFVEYFRLCDVAEVQAT